MTALIRISLQASNSQLEDICQSLDLNLHCRSGSKAEGAQASHLAQEIHQGCECDCVFRVGIILGSPFMFATLSL